MNISSILVTLLMVCSLHPLHVSVTEIEMDEKDKALEITMRVFVDDLELTFRKNRHQPELDVLNPKTTTTDQLVQDYLKKHFAITLDNKPQVVQYLGHEVEDDTFIFYIEVAHVKKWKMIQVKNDMIMETHEDQSNLVHVTVQGNVRSMRLTPQLPMDKLSFDFK